MTRPEVRTPRQLHIEALARRAALHHGAVRRVLEEKLQRLRAVQVLQPASRPVAAGQATQPGPLAGLLAHIARQPGASPLQNTAVSAAPGASTAAVGVELKAIRDYRSTWARLSAERSLHLALAKVPGNAGPLNTQRLLHQALRLMQDASPDYLLHFMAHAEALLALDRVNSTLPPK